jgi:hypothetical protein
MRKGRFGDAGGMSGSGELPCAKPVTVETEEQLREELGGIAGSLTPSTDWTQRVDALLRLEGLLLGGAAQLAGFAEVLQALRDPLIAQVGRDVALCCSLPPPEDAHFGSQCFWPLSHRELRAVQLEAI